MTAGKIVAGSIVAIAVIFGAFVWFTQIYAYYEEVPAEGIAIRLTPLGEGATPEEMLANDVEAIDADSSPLRFRACFQTPESLALLTESYVIFDEAVPLVAPGWFDCFDAAEIGDALETGEAIAFMGERNISDGIDRVVAVFPDGRAFAWHQLNEKYAD